MDPNKPAIGISACLFGDCVRYDGEDKRSPLIIETLSGHLRWVRVCPEVECGLPVPREPMQLMGDIDRPRLITVNTACDMTEQLTKWSSGKLKELEGESICGFIVKSRSPSCALNDAKFYPSDGGHVTVSPGLFTRALRMHFPLIPVCDEESFTDHDSILRFIEQARQLLHAHSINKS